jgi:hypothetical protein
MSAETAGPREADAYACAVVNTLAADFPDLRDPVVAGVVLEHVYLYIRSNRYLEVILDAPPVARWRLIGHTGHVELSCHRLNPTEDDQERLTRLNAALHALLTDTEEEV